ncbi:MAG: response regulator transcription factor [Planctomycetota bacterium]|jgi:FixJ family two-component response regulator
MTESRGTVVLVDDDISIRRGLARLLKSHGYEVEAFGSAREFLGAGLDCPIPACLILDVRMPGLDGINLQKELVSREGSAPIVFITGHGDIPMSVTAMKRGAVDFLPKPFDEGDLLKSVEAALRKDRRDRRRLEESRRARRRAETLTPREYEILTYVITGMLNKQIAFALDISEKTVKVHRGRVMKKMGARSVAELVRLAENAGVLPADFGG